MPMQTITTPAGEELIILSRQEYQNLIDARDHAAALRDVASDAMQTLSEKELDAYLDASTPLAFWRKQRGLTQARLAEFVGISQGFLAQIETGKRVGEVGLYLRFAKVLHIRMEDLMVVNPGYEPVSEEEGGPGQLVFPLRPRGGYFPGEGHQFTIPFIDVSAEKHDNGYDLDCKIEDDALMALAGRDICNDSDAAAVLRENEHHIVQIMKLKWKTLGIAPTSPKKHNARTICRADFDRYKAMMAA